MIDTRRLTVRERQVLSHVLRLLRDKEIAEELHISVHTVKFHVSNLLRKTGKKRRVELIICHELAVYKGKSGRAVTDAGSYIQ